MALWAALLKFQNVLRQSDDHGDLPITLLFHIPFNSFLNLIDRVVEPTTIRIGLILLFTTPQILQGVSLNILEIARRFVTDERPILRMINFDRQVQLFGLGFLGTETYPENIAI